MLNQGRRSARLCSTWARLEMENFCSFLFASLLYCSPSIVGNLKNVLYYSYLMIVKIWFSLWFWRFLLQKVYHFMQASCMHRANIAHASCVNRACTALTSRVHRVCIAGNCLTASQTRLHVLARNNGCFSGIKMYFLRKGWKWLVQ